jgi:hypothetical protein
MRKDERKTPKGSRAKKAAVKNQTVKDLTVRDAKAVKGGRLFREGDKDKNTVLD